MILWFYVSTCHLWQHHKSSLVSPVCLGISWGLFRPVSKIFLATSVGILFAVMVLAQSRAHSSCSVALSCLVHNYLLCNLTEVCTPSSWNFECSTNQMFNEIFSQTKHWTDESINAINVYILTCPSVLFSTDSFPRGEFFWVIPQHCTQIYIFYDTQLVVRVKQRKVTSSSWNLLPVVLGLMQK